MSSSILETLEIDELYKRKKHLLLQLFLVDKEIENKLIFNVDSSIFSKMNLSDESLVSKTCLEVLTNENKTDINQDKIKKITIRIKKV